MTPSNDASANHPNPDPSYGYAWLWWDVYPSCDWPGWQNGPCRDHNVTYRLCDLAWWQQGEAALGDWLSKFNFGSVQITKTRQNNCGVPSDLLFYGASSQQQIVNFCGVWAPACIKPVEEAVDSFVGRTEAKRADSITDGPWFAQLYAPEAEHGYAHEIGHMFGLAHHSTCHNVNVMEAGGPGCVALASSADVATGRCAYIYIC